MSKEALYPSQINTKTISCRISALDYVNFLQDALSKGITLNDWLLMRIYTNQSILGTNDQDFSIVYKFLNKEKDYESPGYSIYDFLDQVNEDICIKTPKDIIDLFNIILDQVNYDNKIKIKLGSQLMELEQSKEKFNQPNLSDIKAQILTLCKTKFKDQKELKNYMFDVNELLEELG